MLVIKNIQLPSTGENGDVPKASGLEYTALYTRIRSLRHYFEF